MSEEKNGGIVSKANQTGKGGGSSLTKGLESRMKGEPDVFTQQLGPSACNSVILSLISGQSDLQAALQSHVL